MYYADYLAERYIALVPKVASISLQWAIKRSRISHYLRFPITLDQVFFEGLSPYLWTVRNPFDRIFSFNDMPFRTRSKKNESDEVFVARLLNGEYDNNFHVKLQSILLPPGQAEHEIRFETLQADFARLAPVLGWPLLPHRNRGSGVPWLTRFNALPDPMKDGLVTRYRPDCERFGYDTPR